MRSILVYDEHEKLICQALARKSTHPFVKLAKDKPMARKTWKKQLAHQRKLEKTLQESSAAIRKQVEEATSEFILPHIEMENSIFNNTPLLKHAASEREEAAIENLSHEPLIVSEKQLSEEEQGMKALDKLFDKIGI